MSAVAEAVWAFEEHEHRDLARGLHHIHEAGAGIGHESRDELAAHVLGVLDWVGHTLEPHLAWEDAWLYPEIDALAGTAWATSIARFDHQQLREMVARIRTDYESLPALPPGERHTALRYDLFGLEALLRAHLEREERFLVPLLDDDAPEPVRRSITIEATPV
jgi:iron-sulfur cluster repair protein YtfE (RIC family)